MNKNEFELHVKNLGIKFPKGLEWAKANIVLKKYKPFGVSKQYPYMPLLVPPIELVSIIDRLIYRVVPLYPFLMVSKTGIVREVETFKYIESYEMGNYNRISVVVNGKQHSVSIHRLVAMAWVPNDDFIKNNIVDHIDGNKHNNVANNLRWTDASLNSSRVRNIIDFRWWAKKIGDDHVHKFSSLSRLAEFLGTDQRAYSAKRCPFIAKTKHGSFIIEDALNFKGWSLEKDYRADGKKILYYIDNVGYTSIKDVVKAYGLDERWIPYRDKVLTLLKKQGHKVIANYTESKQGDCIEVINTRTNEVMKFSKRSEGYKAIGISKNAFNERLSGKRKGELINGYLIKWCGEDVDVVDKDDRKVLLTKDGETYEFNSLRKAAEYLRVDRKTLMNTQEYKGYSIDIQ